MKASKLVAASALAIGVIAIPSSAGAADFPDSYTVAVNPTSVLPGGSVEVTATDSNTAGGSVCQDAPYSITLDYTQVGGTTASVGVGEGLTDDDTANVDTTITIPADAADSDAAGSSASVSVAVDCEQQPPQARSHAAQPAVDAPVTPAALTISPYTGTIKTSPTFAFRGSKINVTLNNCRGGAISAKFTSYGHASTAISVAGAGTDTAAGTFNVPDNTTFGPGSITASCWQSNFAAKRLFVGSEEEGEGEPPEAGGSGGQPVARHAHAVTSTPTFTG